MASHPNFCSCPRRGKWNPSTRFSSVEYNWLIIQEPKHTPKEYQAITSFVENICTDFENHMF